MFLNFEQNMDSYDPERKSQELKNIWNVIMQKGANELDKSDVAAVIEPAFCNIFVYYDIASYTERCESGQDATILKNYENPDSTLQASNKK